MAKRTDTHRPSAINPTEYEYVGMEYMKIEGFGDCELVLEMRRRIQEHMARTGGHYSTHQHGGTCHICGSVNAVYTHLFYHRPTNTYIRTGTECTDKLDYAGAAGDMGAFKAAIKDYRELQKGKRKAKGILEEHGLGQALEIRAAYLAVPVPEQLTREYQDRWGAAFTITDMVNRLEKYGSISDKALGYMAKLIERHNSYEARQAQRAAEKAQAADCPTGRVQITGTVLKTKVQETEYGQSLKMLVKATEGFTVWGTVPAGLEAKYGATVTFTATVQPSKDDSKFGFFKRPTCKGGK